MNRRSLLTIALAVLGLGAIQIKPVPDNFQRGLWSKVYYMSCEGILIREVSVVRRVPKPSCGYTWLEVHFGEPLVVSKIVFYENNKCLGQFVCTCATPVTGYGVRECLLK